MEIATVTMDSTSEAASVTGSGSRATNARGNKILYFLLAILGFSFWFFMAAPFASHRETYWWLAMAATQPFSHAFGVISSTYRPISQPVTWLGFVLLDPHIFPTNVLRQTVLQGLIYALFVAAWWLAYSRAAQRRLFAAIACVTGGVFFSGYIHLFHIYGIMYVPVILMLGALLYFRSSGTFAKHEPWLAIVALLSVFWHPFTTGLFVGYSFGFYLDMFRERSRGQHVRALTMILAGCLAVAILVVLFPREHAPLGTKLLGFVVSYQTNEVNRFASLVAFLLTQTTVLSMGLSPRWKVGALLLVTALSAILFLNHLPLLLLWPCTALIKLLRLRCWSLFFLTLTAALLPLGGGIGGPMHALFALILSAFAISLDWTQGERAVSFLAPRHVGAITAAAAVCVLLVRAGVEIPVLTKVASPLLAERERTYQLENILAWLHTSSYNGYEIAFVEGSGSPVQDVQNAITRRNRPPAIIDDAQLFWDTCLRRPTGEHPIPGAPVATVTFGGFVPANSKPVFGVRGRYADDATVWVRNSER